MSINDVLADTKRMQARPGNDKEHFPVGMIVQIVEPIRNEHGRFAIVISHETTITPFEYQEKNKFTHVLLDDGKTIAAFYYFSLVSVENL